MNVAKEMYDVRGPSEQRQVSLNDNAVETVIYKNQEALKELRESFHRSPPSDVLVRQPKSSVLAAGGINHAPSEFPTTSPQDFKGEALGYY